MHLISIDTLNKRRALTALLAIVVAATAAGCGGSSSHGRHASSTTASTQPSGTAQNGTIVYGSLPGVGTAAKGGTLSYAQTGGSRATEILPLLSDQNTSTQDFQLNAAMYLPLFNGPDGAVPSVDYAQSVASGPPTFSDGDRTVTITLRRGLRWSDDAPVDANDVLFYIALCKAAIAEGEANWSQYITGQFPHSVMSASAPNPHTVVLHLDRPYNPGYFVLDQMEDTGGGVFPLPSTAWDVDRRSGPHLADWRRPAVARRIYDYLYKQGTSISTFASNPLWRDVDGAFSLRTFSATNGSYTMTPNPSYGLSPRPAFSELSVQSYTSPDAALDALRAGAVDIVPIDASQLGEAASLRADGASVFGAPGFSWAAGTLNFKDRANDFDHVIAQRYVRAALEHLVDEPAFIKGLFRGAAAADYGPVPTAPSSPYAPAGVATPPYPYSPSAAVALLTAHGWKVVPGATTTCARPGTGPGECGAGIPAGTPIRFTWDNAPASSSQAELLGTEAVASIARQAAGIDITVRVRSDNYIENNVNDSDPAAARYTNTWGAVTTDTVALIDYYPTQAGFDIPGGLDVGGYDNPTATRLMDASVHSGDVSAVKTEAAYLSRDLPQLFLPNPDVLYVVAKGVGGPASSWLSLSEGAAFFPQYWYRTSG